MISVLIVEDEQIIRNGLLYTIDWLSMNAVVVGAAATGKDGLEKIRSLRPDIVLTDIKMPGMSGLDMIAAAQREGFEFIPMLLTSYSDFDYAKSAIALGVFDYILKPVDDAKMKEAKRRAQEQLKKTRAVQAVQNTTLVNEHTKTVLFTMVSDNPYIDSCLKCIEQHYMGRPNIEQLAQALKVSASYLSRLFKKHTSMTFLDFLNYYRVQKAIGLLSSKMYRVYEVASMTGFSSYKRFYEVFKAHTGISPTEFVNSRNG